MANTYSDFSANTNWRNVTATITALSGVAATIQNKGPDNILAVFSSSASAPTTDYGLVLHKGESYTGTAANIWVRSLAQTATIACGTADPTSGGGGGSSGPSNPGFSAYTAGASLDARAWGEVDFFVSIAPTTAYPIQWDDGSGAWPQAYATLYPSSGSPTFFATSIPVGFTGKVSLSGGTFVRLASSGAGATIRSALIGGSASGTYVAPTAYTPGNTFDATQYGRAEFFASVAPTTAYPIQTSDGSGTWLTAYATLYPASGAPSFFATAVPVGFTGRVSLAGGLLVRLSSAGAGGTFTYFGGQ